MAGNLQPLVSNQPIVKDDGTPTEYFIRWAQQKQIDISGGITAQEAEELISAALTDYVQNSRKIIAGVGLDGGGDLSADRTINLEDTAVTPGTYGDAAHVGQFSVDQQGRVISAVNVPVSGGGGGGDLIPWNTLAFSSVSQSRFGVTVFPSTTPITAAASQKLQIEVAFKRLINADAALFASVDGTHAYAIAAQSDSNLVNYRYNAAVQTAINASGSGASGQNFTGTWIITLTIEVATTTLNNIYSVVNDQRVNPQGTPSDINVNMIGSVVAYLRIANFADLIAARYRVV